MASREMYTGELLKELGKEVPQVKENQIYKQLLSTFDNDHTVNERRRIALNKSPGEMIHQLSLIEDVCEQNDFLTSLIKLYKKDIIKKISDL